MTTAPLSSAPILRRAGWCIAAFAALAFASALHRVWGQGDSVDLIVAAAIAAWALLGFGAALAVIGAVALAILARPQDAPPPPANVFPFATRGGEHP